MAEANNSPLSPRTGVSFAQSDDLGAEQFLRQYKALRLPTMTSR